MANWTREWFDDDYATLYAHRDAAEAEMAVATALRRVPALTQGPVLDLACGAGRHLCVLRRHNPNAFGLDLSPHLLKRAPISLRPWLIRADMRHLPVRPGCLSAVTLWFTSFGYFSDDENRALLRSIRNSLRSDGVLLLDLFNTLRLPRTLVAEETLEREHLRIHVRRSLEGSHVVKHLTLWSPDGRRREVTERIRCYTPEAMDHVSASVGLVRNDTWGDYAGYPFDPEHSPRWIATYRVKT